MTIAVHEPSNSLIVTAPDQLFKEVEQLAQLIDARSKQVFLVIPTTNPATQSMLLKVFSGKVRTGSGRTESRSPSRPASPSQSPGQIGVDQRPWIPKKELKRQLDALQTRGSGR